MDWRRINSNMRWYRWGVPVVALAAALTPWFFAGNANDAATIGAAVACFLLWNWVAGTSSATEKALDEALTRIGTLEREVEGLRQGRNPGAP